MDQDDQSSPSRASELHSISPYYECFVFFGKSLVYILIAGRGLEHFLFMHYAIVATVISSQSLILAVHMTLKACDYAD